MKQFTQVNCQYGAPMGRMSYGTAANFDGEGRVLRLFKVNLDSGGYDDGGAYWGLAARGHQLWCAQDGSLEYQQFVRAGTRNGAAHKLGIKSEQLKNPLTNIWRHRFKIVAEFAGDPRGARIYIYEWGEMVQGVYFGTKNEAIDHLAELIGKTNEDWL